MTTFGFQSCDCDGVTCSLILKATGPSLCGFALVLILLSRSRSLINLTQLEYSADQRCYHSCSEQNSFAHFLIFGVLFCFSGMLLTTIGVWAVTCPGTMDGQGFNLTIKVNENEKCKLLFLQIMGPAVTFVGICFLLMAHVKRKVVLRPDEENTSTNDQQPCMPGPCQIATDSSGLVLPLPPPYFPEPPPMVNDSCEVNHPTPSDDPPPYYSVVFRRAEENQDDLQDTLRVDEVPDSIPPPSYDEIFPVESEDTSGH
ncbi:transmembrane protein 171-like [Pristis pectinata]|uniref:transmembrane protein 171-like n=1 Tax=Pristis pectinata TaxID=685728 RepID=UPI00223DDACE|nr:transmembrane protein 171-like [Pristis pectinata]